MNCQECKALLLELLDGDLPAAQAAEVRSTAALCPECEQELLRLEQGMTFGAELPVAQVPPELSRRILDVAHAHAAEAQATAIPSAARLSGPGILRGWLDNFVERFATGPQFAMATLMLLIAVGTFWAVPSLRRSPEAVGGSVVTVDTHGEAVASGVALEPADRLDLAVDMRHGRIRTKAEQRSLGRHAPPDHAAAAPGALEGAAEGADAPAQADDPETWPPQDEDEVARLEGQAEAPHFAADLAELVDDATAAMPAAPMPQAVAKRSKASAPQLQPKSDGYSAAPVSAPAAAAAPGPERKAGVAQTPRATLEIAREARAGGDCAAAVIYYERVILASPHGELGTAAMREAAKCYASLGRTRRASELESMLAQRDDASPERGKKAAKPNAAAAGYAQ